MATLLPANAYLTADTAIPDQAWQAAGLAPMPDIAALGDCDVGTLRAFAGIDAQSPAGRVFVARAGAMADALAAVAVTPDVARAAAARRYQERYAQGELAG